MCADLRFNCSLFGGSANEFSSDAALRVSVFHFCGVDDFIVGIFVVIDFDGVSGGNGAGALSDGSLEDGSEFDGGAESEVYFENYRVNYFARGDVGGGDGADYRV